MGLKKTILNNEIKQHYSLDAIDSLNCLYNIIVGKKSNGKSFQAKKRAIEDFVNYGNSSVWWRRFYKDIVKSSCMTMFSGISNKLVEKWTNGRANFIHYGNKAFYLAWYDAETKVTTIENEPFLRIYCLENWEHDRDTDIPNLANIFFDEFMTRQENGRYLYNEFVLFMNEVSTFIRDRDGVKVWLMGNTVTKNCPYFEEFGLTHIYQQEQGTIDVYSFNGQCEIAVEFCAQTTSKASDKYFAFDNPSMKMITTGQYDMSVYPHLVFDYNTEDIFETFVICLQSTMVQGELIATDDEEFVYFHIKTTPIKKNTRIYDITKIKQGDTIPNIYKATDSLSKAIVRKINNDSVYYQSNTVGELVNDYLNNCKI